MDIRIKRVYEPAAPGDGFRVLVDRLWPRGVSKEAAALDLWEKEAAPSTELRRAWHAEVDSRSPAHFAGFAADYRAELSGGAAGAALDELVRLAREHSPLTLLYGARDPETNHAVVLREALLERLRGDG
ncbi:DUF488 domain-containing protein [Leucobacter ruminantium]|uniref:DUF488 family protein n=1 Tax=Leucobacter ruminantium TaxID=1289170 RepID=A0A939LSU3_9MICO|nr:DUF488 family protein [Leucobacter ruminantium]MBO1803727.1 DUF488 family protein [Leucobacter ruminantium]